MPSPVPDHALSRRVEEAGLNAWPAPRQILLDGWLLRCVGGPSRRVNAVTPLRSSEQPLGDKIAACEALYAAQGQPAIFRLPGIVEPALDAELARRGYRAEGETCVLYRSLDGAAGAADPQVILQPAPDDIWLAALAALQGQDERHRQASRQVLESLMLPARFAALAVDGAIAALAMVAIHDGMASLNLVATSREHRRSGLARRVLNTALSWARTAGATGACLQVEAGNAPARALYADIGFTRELYRYHYRRQAG